MNSKAVKILHQELQDEIAASTNNIHLHKYLHLVVSNEALRNLVRELLSELMVNSGERNKELIEAAQAALVDE